MDAAVYKHVVLGLIFLKYISDAFEERHTQLQTEKAQGADPEDPDAIDRVLRKHAASVGLNRGYSAHSMKATFITTALEKGADLEAVQKAAGNRGPSTTKLYDRRLYNPEKSASFFANY